MKTPIKIRVIPLLLLFLFPWLFFQCSPEKNTAITRFYHNLTSYYNILFNAKESYEEGLNRYKEGHQYDFTRTLPLFINGNETLSENIKPQMDRTIEKCSKLIRLHSISSKPKSLEDKRNLSKEEKEYYNKSEFNKYVDDAYLLMGKAYFWEMEYGTAAKLLQHASWEFKNELIQQESKIWLSRCHIEMNNFREAEKVLAGFEKEHALSDNFATEFFATYADYHIKQDQPEDAIPHLKKAIDHADKKEKRVRYSFILAQLYEEAEKHNEAFRQYEAVIDMNPDYKMEFNARLKRATLSQITRRGGNEVKRDLENMVGNNKNEEYLDQIYYALGEIAVAENNFQQALDYYKKSIAHNTDNENQKGLSYLSVADIYFQNKKYSNAQAYYDSAVTTIESDYPGYTDLFMKTQHLTSLVDNLNTIEREDSLQKVARMEPAERNRLISQLIEKRRKSEQQKTRDQQNQLSAQRRQNTNRNRTDGAWYFYSSTAIQNGQSEFENRWGNRELKDNWRISSKTQADFEGFSDSEEQEQAQKTNQQQYSKSNKQYYVKNLPLTDSAMEASHSKIQEAYFSVGNIYMNDLNNPAKAIEAFQTLNEQYPDNPFKLTCYYNMHKLYKKQDNTSQAERYKDKILNEYPESNHAKVLNNPDYFRELENRKNEAEKLYSESLELYRNNQYGKVLDNCRKAKEQLEDSTYLARFDYLEALVIGQTRDIISFRNRLQSLVESYSETDVSGQAKDILSYLQKTELQQLNKKFAQNKPGSDDGEKSTPDTSGEDVSTAREVEDSLYTFNKDGPYYFAIIANPEKIDLDRLRFEVINFNLDYFLQKDYNTEISEFNEFYNIITVRKFEDYSTAKKYFDLLSKREERVFSEVDSNEYRYFFISVKNYLTLLDKKSIIEYINFFKERTI
ncbi:MAG: tetratricopeptide repeat protein [Bacteroidales bacterium]|nr:tetratricopeptide repeat protein [Bacteroidales bacterium]